MSDLGDAQLAAMIERLRALPDVTRAVLPQLARVAEEHLQGTIRAGTDAYGKAWAPKKRGGGKPLTNAAAAMRVAFVGLTLVMRLTGAEALHHRGRVTGAGPRSGRVRRILPLGEIPAPLLERFQQVLIDGFKRAVGGRA